MPIFICPQCGSPNVTVTGGLNGPNGWLGRWLWCFRWRGRRTRELGCVLLKCRDCGYHCLICLD